MRRLAQTLMVGGVVYPAGTWEADIDGYVQRDDVWQDDSDDQGTEMHLRVTADLREVVEYLVERHLAEPETSVTDLLSGAQEVFAASQEPAEDPADDNGPDGDPGQADDDDGDVDAPANPKEQPAPEQDRYAGWRIDKLRNEAASRGIAIEDPSDKQVILAALRADDASSES